MFSSLKSSVSTTDLVCRSSMSKYYGLTSVEIHYTMSNLCIMHHLVSNYIDILDLIILFCVLTQSLVNQYIQLLGKIRFNKSKQFVHESDIGSSFIQWRMSRSGQQTWQRSCITWVVDLLFSGNIVYYLEGITRSWWIRGDMSEPSDGDPWRSCIPMENERHLLNRRKQLIKWIKIFSNKKAKTFLRVIINLAKRKSLRELSTRSGVVIMSLNVQKSLLTLWTGLVDCDTKRPLLEITDSREYKYYWKITVTNIISSAFLQNT